MSNRINTDMRGYLAYLNAAWSLKEFMENNCEFCDRFKMLLEFCACDSLRGSGYSYSIHLLFRQLTGNARNSKLGSSATQLIEWYCAIIKKGVTLLLRVFVSMSTLNCNRENYGL